MVFTFQSPFLAGLSGYIAEQVSARICYIGSWLSIIQGDNRAIVRAASAASKAADHILAFRDAPNAHAYETEEAPVERRAA